VKAGTTPALLHSRRLARWHLCCALLAFRWATAMLIAISLCSSHYPMRRTWHFRGVAYAVALVYSCR